MERSKCRGQPQSTWKPDPNAHGRCTFAGGLQDLTEQDCLGRPGSSWKPYPDPWGPCTFEDVSRRSDAFRPHCRIGGQPVNWPSLGEKDGFPY